MFFYFLYALCLKHVLFKKKVRDVTINVYLSLYKVSIILVRF